jgi:hypothetical protein
MRPTSWIPLFVVCACLCSCSEPRLECGADAVTGTLSSMVRDRVLVVAADSYPATIDASKRAALSKATRVTPVEMKLVEWDTVRGRLACIATVVVDAPGPQMDTNLRREAKLPYRVMRDSGEVFLVEIKYADLMTIVPARPGSSAGASANP